MKTLPWLPEGVYNLENVGNTELLTLRFEVKLGGTEPTQQGPQKDSFWPIAPPGARNGADIKRNAGSAKDKSGEPVAKDESAYSNAGTDCGDAVTKETPE